MNNIRYNFALDVNGKRRHINEKCSPQPFRCGDCNEEMVARRGGRIGGITPIKQGHSASLGLILTTRYIAMLRTSSLRTSIADETKVANTGWD